MLCARRFFRFNEEAAGTHEGGPFKTEAEAHKAMASIKECEGLGAREHPYPMAG
jgi:hypothetical protein